MTRRAQYAAHTTGLMAEIVVYIGAIGHIVTCDITDHDGQTIQTWSERGHNEIGAKQLAKIYHQRLMRNWNMGLLWHSGRREADTTTRAA